MKEDPTAIPIDLDATKQRMSGVATHGMTPFDVPYISKIKDSLWQGGCREGLVLPNNIDIVVSLYPWEKYEINSNIERFEIEMYDSLDQTYEQVDEIAEMVNGFLNKGKTVLVHCQAGLNRSSLVVVRALMLQGMDAEGAISLIRQRRSSACLCNPAFEKYLRSLDKPQAKE